MGIFDSLFGKKKNENSRQASCSTNDLTGKQVQTPAKSSNSVKSSVMNFKKWTKTVSVQSIYKKNISFHVERFEEWEAGRCINKGPLNFDIHFIVRGDCISVDIPQNDKFRTHRSVTFPFLGSDMLEDRVQYVNAPGISTDSTKPVVLHIFVKNGKIDCIRFAMSFPDRIVEFYGYQVESQTSNPENFNVVSCEVTSSDNYKLTFLSSLINVATCDGEIMDVEMQTIMAYIQREGLKESDLVRVITNPASIPNVVPQSPAIRAQHIRDVVTLSMVDGHFHPKEYVLCKQIAAGLGFRPEVVDVIRQELNNKIGANI